jgi:hypothetical protein
VRYIEVVPADIAIANRLAHEVLGRTLDELPPQTRKLLTAVHAWVKGECERQALHRTDFRFTRRQVRELTGWGDTQLKIHLARLAELEYVLVHRVQRGQGFAYELLYDGQGEDGERFLMGLAEAFGYDGERSGQMEGQSAPGRSAVGTVSAAGRPAETAASSSADAASGVTAGAAAPIAYLAASRGESYRTPSFAAES